MKTAKRITALVLVSVLLILSLTSCGTPKAASASGTCENGLVWEYDADSTTLKISGNGAMKNFASAADAPWASVKSSAKTLTISEGVLAIGDYAFYGFSALENVTVPASVTAIGKCSFAFDTALKNISLPSSLATVGDSAFEGCSALSAAFIPASVQSIGERTFAFCSSITDAAILADIAIPAHTFYACRSLERLLLSASITEDRVADNAFENCKKSFADAKRTESDTADATVTVKFTDTEGNELHAPEVREAIAYGGSYSVVCPTVEGYTAETLTVTGYLYGSNEEITVKYTKNDVPAETQPNEDDKEKEEIGPSTYIAIAIFAIVLIGIGVAAFLLMRSEKKNANKNTTTVRKNQTNGKKK